MRYVKYFFIIGIFLMLGACARYDCKPRIATVLPGTDTAVVELYIDKNGFPQAYVETVRVYPGQKIVFIGPDKFEIFFKDQRSPIGRFEAQSDNSIVAIEIPRDIFERDQRDSREKELKEKLFYRYGIRANGKITDPGIEIVRR